MGVLDSISIHNSSKTFLEGFDKAVRLRQLHATHRLQESRRGAEEFFDLNMLPRPRVKSATTMPEMARQKSKFETMGPWSEDAKSFIKDLAAKLREATGDPPSKEYLVQRISLAIQRGNAASVLGTMSPSSNCDDYI